MPKKVRWLYYLSVVFVLFFNLFVVSHMLAIAEGQRDEKTTSPKNVCCLYYLSVVFFVVVVISLVSHMLAMAEGK